MLHATTLNDALTLNHDTVQDEPTDVEVVLGKSKVYLKTEDILDALAQIGVVRKVEFIPGSGLAAYVPC